MNILITGASGFLGNELIKQCSDRNYNVVGIANSETRIQKTKFLNSEIPIFSLVIYSDVDRLNQIIKEYEKLWYKNNTIGVISKNRKSLGKNDTWKIFAKILSFKKVIISL